MPALIKKENWFIIQGETKPCIECPGCGCGLLGDVAPHGVRADGRIFNSVVCDCGFHQYVILENWTGGMIPHK